MKNPIPSSEITPKSDYQNRRRFIKNSFKIAAAAYLTASCSPIKKAAPTATLDPNSPIGQFDVDEMGNPLTAYQDILGYTNFYEFSTSKTEPTKLASDFITDPWSVEISGFVNKPITLDIDQIRNLFDEEERIYRMRCVEAWSMVIPWYGFQLSKILEMVEPND